MDIPLTVELLPDPDIGGFTARLPDIPAHGEGETEDEAIAQRLAPSRVLLSGDTDLASPGHRST